MSEMMTAKAVKMQGEAETEGKQTGLHHASRRTDVIGGMVRVDTVENTRIPVLMQMVGDMSRAKEPQEVQRAYAAGFDKLNGPTGYISLSTRGLGAGEYRITRMILEEGAFERIAAEDPWRHREQLPVHRGGLLGELIRSAYPELLHHVHLRGDPVLGDALAGYGSLMAIPLFDDGQPLNWAILLRREAEGYSVQNLEDAILEGNLVGGQVRNTLMVRELEAAHARVRQEMEHVARIQKALLPRTWVEARGLSFAASYETFDTAGGDLYDVTRLARWHRGRSEDAPVGILVADASGHGPAAAVVSAMLNAILYSYQGGPEDSPADVLMFANRHLYTKRLEGMFVTAFLASYMPGTGELFYARAGHNPPLIKNAGSGGAVRRLDDVGGIPLGILEEAEYECGKVKLERGQTLVLYTDGITDAQDRGRRAFGVEGIERALRECTGEAECVVGSITRALREHEDGLRPIDDQTVLAMGVG